MACNFNCLIEIEGFFNVTRSHIHSKITNVLETVQHRETLLLQITNVKSYGLSK